MTKEYSSYLAHHGIKGQKWGVRRYQNEDGTLTEEGRQKLYNEYGQQHVNAVVYSKLFKEYSDPRKTTTKEVAEHNARQAIKSEKISRYDLEMRNLFQNNKSVTLSDMEKASEKFAKKYGLDSEEILAEERAFWNKFFNG